MKSGIGTATVELGAAFSGVKVSALVAANPLGDIIDPATGAVVAGARRSPESSEFLNTARHMKDRGLRAEVGRGHTTLAVVATNASLTKVEATMLAQRAHHGFVKAISPVHTRADGDLAIALSCGELPADLDALCIAAGEAVAAAIVRAARLARTLGGVRGLAG
jgi:L-aminopeptidase/D-esterase-like protein